MLFVNFKMLFIKISPIKILKVLSTQSPYFFFHKYFPYFLNSLTWKLAFPPFSFWPSILGVYITLCLSIVLSVITFVSTNFFIIFFSIFTYFFFYLILILLGFRFNFLFSILSLISSSFYISIMNIFKFSFVILDICFLLITLKQLLVYWLYKI